jgi:hypothetical protein
MRPFDVNEIAMMHGDPESLRALAGIHEVKITMGEPIGHDCTPNIERKAELLAEADRIQSEWEG